MDEVVHHILYHQQQVLLCVHQKQEHQLVVVEVGALLHTHTQVVRKIIEAVQQVDDVLLHLMDEVVLLMQDVVLQKLHQHVMIEHGVLHHEHIHLLVRVVIVVQQVDDVLQHLMDEVVQHIQVVR